MRTAYPLPPYAYTPGRNVHPNHPGGHGVEPPPATVPTDATWRTSAAWLYAADLFEHGFYWEAHEAWESLWIASGRIGAAAAVFQGLVKLAAAGVKAREGSAAGLAGHLRRGAELLREAAKRRGDARRWAGLDLVALAEAAEALAPQAETLVAAATPDVDAWRLPLPLPLELED